jgi:hypothetical protein
LKLVTACWDRSMGAIFSPTCPIECKGAGGLPCAKHHAKDIGLRATFFARYSRNPVWPKTRVEDGFGLRHIYIKYLFDDLVQYDGYTWVGVGRWVSGVP